MKELNLPGYWDADARPDGKWAAAKYEAPAVRTHAGEIPTEGDIPRFVRVTPNGLFKFAAQGAKRTIEWVDGLWRYDTEPCGIGGPVIYDQTGTLHRADCSKIGTTGYRYVAPDGTLVTGDQSRNRPGTTLLESTDLGDGILVGQGPHGGMWVKLDGRYCEIVPGATFRIVAHRSGDKVAMACYTPTPRGSATAHLRWYTIEELRLLPSRAEPLTIAPQPEPVHEPVVDIGRPLWMGFFEFVPATGLPSNCRIPVVQGDAWLFVEGPSWVYVAGDPDGDPAAIGRAVASEVHDRHEFNILAYVPRGAQHALPTAADIQGVEAYLGATETDAEFMSRISTSLAKCRRAALIANCYTSNTTLTSDLRRVPGLISKLAREHTNVEAILVFSGSGRATGWQDHPEVHDDWRQVFAGITGRPQVYIPPVVEEKEPETPEKPSVPEPHIPPPVEELPPPYVPEPRPPLEPHRPSKPIGGNAIVDFFKALGKINFRKLFR